MPRSLKEFLKKKKGYCSEWRCNCLLLSAWRDYDINWCNCEVPGPEPIPETVEWWQAHCKAFFQNSELYTLMSDEMKAQVIDMIDNPTEEAKPWYVLFTKAFNDWYTFTDFVKEKELTVDETGTIAKLVEDTSWVTWGLFVLMWWLVEVKHFWVDNDLLPINIEALSVYSGELATRYAN